MDQRVLLLETKLIEANEKIIKLQNEIISMLKKQEQSTLSGSRLIIKNLLENFDLVTDANQKNSVQNDQKK